jgi:hypothetical protein
VSNGAIEALRAHKKRQAAERLAAGTAWQDHDLVFCHEDGHPYSRDALNWRFGKVTRQADSATGTRRKDATPQSRS